MGNEELVDTLKNYLELYGDVDTPIYFLGTSEYSPREIKKHL